MRLVLIALVAFGAGCFPEARGVIEVRWSFLELAPPGAMLECPVGFDTAAVHVIPLDSVGDRKSNDECSSSGCVDIYRCNEFIGAADYIPDRYEVFLAITTPTGSSRYADTPSTVVDIVALDAQVTQTILDDGGYFGFDWSMIGGSSNEPLSCSEALVAGVDITVTGSTESRNDTFPCAQGSAHTAGVIEGDYTVSIAALDSADRSIGTVPALTNQRISGPNKTTGLGEVIIPITGK